MNRQVVLVLGAGYGRRMGGPKIFLQQGEDGFLRRILVRCQESKSPVVLVCPQGSLEQVRKLVPGGLKLPLLVEGDGNQPMLASLQVGLRLARQKGLVVGGDRPDGFWVWPVDAPDISGAGSAKAVQAVAEAPEMVWKLRSGGKTGHPTWFPGWSVAEILAGTWPDGLLGFLQQVPDRIRALELNGEKLVDYNTPEELKQREV